MKHPSRFYQGELGLTRVCFGESTGATSPERFELMEHHTTLNCMVTHRWGVRLRYTYFTRSITL